MLAFTGLGGTSNTESNAQVIVPNDMSFTKMWCFQSKTNGTDVTYTLRQNGAATALQCTITTGKLTGSGSSTAVSLSAGDLIDIDTSGSPSSTVGAFGLGN